MRQLKSIRFRITAVAAVAVLAVLVAGGVALVLLQRAALTSNLDQTLAQRADDLTGLVDTGGSLPEGADDGFAQVVNPDGVVIAASINIAGIPALDIAPPARPADVYHSVGGFAFEDDTFRVLSRQLPGGAVIHVAATDESIVESTSALVVALVVTIPILVIALAAVVWWLVGRTLRPVEDIRSEVSEIGTTDLDRRVPQPGTGDEIDRLAETMNEMLVRLETSVERQQRFVADASHELRSPLTRIRSALEVDAAAEATGGAVLEDVVDMQRTVEDLLYLARADEGRTRMERSRVDLDDVVLREAQRIQANDLVAVDLSGVSGAHVIGDRGHLGRAIRNLLDNAERHAEARVTLRLVESAGDAVLTVTDDGPGIAQDDAERIFERFSSLDEARAADTGGAGLGLAIARDIAERHDGSLVVERSEGPGATFKLSIPAAD